MHAGQNTKSLRFQNVEAPILGSIFIGTPSDISEGATLKITRQHAILVELYGSLWRPKPDTVIELSTHKMALNDGIPSHILAACTVDHWRKSSL